MILEENRNRFVEGVTYITHHHTFSSLGTPIQKCVAVTTTKNEGGYWTPIPSISIRLVDPWYHY